MQDPTHGDAATLVIPGPDVRVIHLYSSSYRTQFENDHWMP